MAKFSGPEEIYKSLVQDSDEDWLYGLVAFAVIEEQRIEWMKHQEANTGVKPTAQEVRGWYEQQPEGVLLRAKGEAENALKAYSDEVVKIVMDEEIKEIQDDIIVSEIREIKAFWPQFGVNLAGGFVSSILFATLLIIVAFFVLNDTSPADIGNGIRQQLEDSSNG